MSQEEHADSVSAGGGPDKPPPAARPPALIWTVGHSNSPAEALVATLLEAGIELLVDVRRHPASRRNPRFNSQPFAALLASHAIDYRRAPELGGRRRPVPDSVNAGLRDPGFRGFADYMATPAFGEALDRLIAEARGRRLAVICAEALPWRCHRSLIADALLARGVGVVHLVGGGQRPHALSPLARVEGGAVTYPALL